jgi:glycosyltransferase involved in cell wall biosynthesis
VRHSELAPLYRRAAAAVFPFVVARDGDQEGFGLVVVEAMGSGCPVIASDVPAVRENVLDGVTGWLVPQKDVDRLADAIERCLTDRVASSRMAETARRMVVERFDWSGIAQRYLQALQACIAT